MKSINELREEIKRVEALDSKDFKPAAFKRELGKREMAIHLIRYLETSPTKEFLESEIKRIETLVSNKALEFENFYGDNLFKLSKKDVSKLRKEHENKYGIGKARTQLKTLRYLMS